MLSQNERFIATKNFILDAVKYVIGMPVDVSGVNPHRLRQMVKSGHVKADKMIEVATELHADPVAEPVKRRYTRRAK